MSDAARSSPPELHGVDALVADVETRAERAGGRLLVGIAGAPGSGKSTLAARLVDRLGPAAVLVPMDGFHLANEQLDALGRRDRKGAPDTFDADGYVALLERCRRQVPGDGPLYAPRFVREIEESFGSAIAVPASARVVITEGNYLLVDERPWSGLGRVLDVRYHLAIETALRHERLVARHRSFGRTDEEARAWALGPDEANAALIEAASPRADAIVRL